MTLPLLAPESALFLDIDGTLLELKDDPEEVRASQPVREMLAGLQQKLGGALAVISGRDLPSIDRVFGPLTLAAAGDHGAEIRFAADNASKVFASAEDRAALDAVYAAVESHFDPPPLGVRFDQKSWSLAFDYRQAASEKSRLGERVHAAVAPHQARLTAIDGASCFDVKLRFENKGKAIERFMAAAPFAGRVPVYIGDTGTDEDGFAAVLNRKGRAILVGAPRPTQATERLDDPATLRAWLARSATALER